MGFGSIDVWHLAELFYDPEIVGVQKIRDSVKVSLEGTRIAVHYGCHLMKPKKERHFGTTEHPTWIEEMVAALGAEPVEYRNKMLCCGAGGGVRGYDIVHALDIANEKLINLKEVGVDACGICPFCRNQFDRDGSNRRKFGVWRISD
jgi:heterodisulfide reductase subunit B